MLVFVSSSVFEIIKQYAINLLQKKRECCKIVMETKGKKTIQSSSSSSLHYEVPLGYSIEDVRPNGGIEKFQSATYSNVTSHSDSLNLNP